MKHSLLVPFCYIVFMDFLDNEIKIEPSEVIWYYIQRDDDHQPMIFLRKMVRLYFMENFVNISVKFRILLQQIYI